MQAEQVCIFLFIQETVLPFLTSMTRSWFLPLLKILNAKCLLSGDHAPADSKKLKSSMCVLEIWLLNFRIILPDFASARKRSIPNKSFSERKARYFPSGLTAGATFMLPAFLLSMILAPDILI